KPEFCFCTRWFTRNVRRTRYFCARDVEICYVKTQAAWPRNNLCRLHTLPGPFAGKAIDNSRTQSRVAARNSDYCSDERLHLLLPVSFALLARIGIASILIFWTKTSAAHRNSA